MKILTEMAFFLVIFFFGVAMSLDKIIESFTKKEILFFLEKLKDTKARLSWRKSKLIALLLEHDTKDILKTFTSKQLKKALDLLGEPTLGNKSVCLARLLSCLVVKTPKEELSSPSLKAKKRSRKPDIWTLQKWNDGLKEAIHELHERRWACARRIIDEIIQHNNKADTNLKVVYINQSESMEDAHGLHINNAYLDMTDTRNRELMTLMERLGWSNTEQYFERNDNTKQYF